MPVPASRPSLAVLALAAGLAPWPSLATPPAGPALRADSLYTPAFSPDGRRLAYDARLAADRWAVIIAEADGSRPRRLLAAETASHHSVSWAPDGRRLALLARRGGQWDVYTAAPDGSDLRPVTNDAAREQSPRWSPDGSAIAFVAARMGREAIWLVRPDGSDARVLVDTLDVQPRLAWSPDGRLTFRAMPRGELSEWGKPGRFWTVRADGSALAPLTAAPAHDYNPAWSPDGARLLVDAHWNGGWESDDGGWEIWSLDARGAGRVRITRNGVNDWGPAWSPDGKRIAYCSGRDDRYEIWIMDADGANPRRLTRHVYEGAAPGE